MNLKIKLLAAAAAFALPGSAFAQQPAPTPPSGPAAAPPAATPPAPSSTTTPPTQQPTDATETGAQQPQNMADDAAANQNAQATPPATTPPPAAPAPGAQAQTTPPAPPAAAGPVQQATAADIRVGVQVRDQQGGAVGTIESADAGTAVVNTGTARARLALSSFGRNSAGLVISMTKAQLEAAVAAARPGA